METERIPWLLAALTAGWFGWMAHRAGRTATLWAVGGAAFGLVISTLVLGLGNATSIPFSDHERSVDQAEWIITSAVLIAIIGWLLTASLHRHHLLIWRKLKPDIGSAEPAHNPSKPVQTQAAKPTPGKAQP
jgi:hypothetical protein